MDASNTKPRYQCAPITMTLEFEILAGFWEALSFAWDSFGKFRKKFFSTIFNRSLAQRS